MSDPNWVDFYLRTDGSGREADGFSGWACIVRSATGNMRRFAMGGMTESTVDRAEFTALIEGLRLCAELWDRTLSRGLASEAAGRPRPVIEWYSDRESLVMSVRKVYDRKNCPDLWAAFEYYEDMFEIHPHNVTEPFTETDPDFVDVDLQSSTMREIIKNHSLNTTVNFDVQPKVKSDRKKAAGTDSKD